MIRGHRWRKRAGKEYLTRTGDGWEMIVVFRTVAGWMFVLRTDFAGLVPHLSGRAETRKAAMLKAESRMAEAFRKAAKRTANATQSRRPTR